MVRPVAFRKNEETAANNYYQKDGTESSDEMQSQALAEFDQLVDMLLKNDINVLVVNDIEDPSTPDSIFPNNWISMHEDGQVWLYPMFAENRRKERDKEILTTLSTQYQVTEIVDLTKWEQKSNFLEGTGSLILDRINKMAYAALSDRTHSQVLKAFDRQSGYEVCSFRAMQTVDGRRLPIYHTNVMMSVGEGFALVCASSIDDSEEKANLLRTLQKKGKEVIEISEAQNNQFAGNILQVANNKGQRHIVMSQAAYDSLDQGQIERLSSHGLLVYSPIPTIERLGGGSVRCMMAEVFLPLKK
ncbi:MAG: amidinotransferase [Cyclobacteriaceae bacterium]|nr:amidinotransferase [Cyclobacteriaceae bacterium HetDA_MAG_MS6]